MEKKKKSNQRGREREAREVLRPDPLVATSALPGGPAQGAPAAERPRSPSPRWAGGSPALRKTRIDQTRKEFFSTANEQEARLPALPSPRPVLPLRPPHPSPPLSFLLGLCSGLEGSGLRSEPACGGGAGPSQPGRVRPQRPAILSSPAAAVGPGAGRALEGPAARVPPSSLRWDFFFFSSKRRAGGLQQIRREGRRKMPSLDFSPPLLHPSRPFPKKSF